MSRLEELIQELCPDGVEFVPLGEVLKNNNAIVCVSKKDYKEIGRIPIIDQSQAYIAAYTDNESAIPPILPCIIFGDHTRVIKYAEHKFAQGDSGTKVFVPVSKNIVVKYIFYAFCNLDIPSRGYNRHWSIVKDIKIPLPPLPVQEEIVRILDKFTALEAELEAELEARKKQYGYYLDFLLAHEPNCIPQYNIEWCAISEAFHFLNGYTPSTSDPSFWEDGTIPWFRMEDIRTNGRILSDSIQHITQNAVKGTLFPANSIILAISATIGEHALLTAEALSNQRFVCLAIKAEYLDRIDIKYFFYYCFLIDQWCLENTTLGNFLSVDMGKLRKLKIPLPPLAVQKRIVSILDRFDALVNDIMQGLPAELAARRRQYEYYRDKLLTFKEKVS